MNPILKTIVFMGPQGSGKGTQVKLLCDYLESLKTVPVFHYETGSSFRELAEEKGYTQKLVHDTLERGKLQPVFLSVGLWAQAFLQGLNGNEHIVIDGFPRTVHEATVLDTAFDFYKREQPTVVSIALPEEETRKRLALRARSDDTEDAITERLSWYNEHGRAVLEYYRNKEGYVVHDIDGMQSPEEVHEAIKKVLNV